MTNQNPTLPPLLERPVTLANLNATHFNGKSGVVIGFNEERNRFIVQLEGEIKLLKACNLLPALSIGQSSEVNSQIVSLETTKQIKNGLKVFRWLEKNRIGNASESEIWTKLVWCRKMKESFSQDPTMKPQLVHVLQKLIDESVHTPNLHIFVKFELATLYMKSNPAKSRALLCPHLEHHYGILPKIASILLPVCKGHSMEEMVELYYQTKEFIQSKNYDGRLSLHMFHLSALKFLIMFCKKFNQTENILSEVQFLRDKLLEYNTSPCLNLVIGQSYFLEKNYEEAIMHFKIFLDYINSYYGSATNTIYQALSPMFYCYVKLKRKNDAKKCMKQMKKFSPIEPQMKALFDQMPEDDENITAKDETIAFKRNLRKCSYFYCKNVESKIGEFQKCGACHKTYYCSTKCYKLHWKKQHKHTCSKNIEI